MRECVRAVLVLVEDCTVGTENPLEELAKLVEPLVVRRQGEVAEPI